MWFALNEVNLRFDADAFYAFCDALAGMMALANDQRSFETALLELVETCFPRSSAEARADFVALAQVPNEKRGTGSRIKSIDIACAKGLCDYYFLKRIGPMFPAIWCGAPVEAPRDAEASA